MAVRVVILRGHQANPWELAPWTEPPVRERFDVSYLRTRRQWFDTSKLDLESRLTLTLRDLLPPGRLGDLAVRVPGDRYLGLASALRGADIVHAQELGYWYSMQAARLKSRLGFRLVLTVWETIPFIDAYRNARTRAYRRRTLEATDLFLASTERARAALLLEGAPAERIRVSPPGVALDRFQAAARSPDTRPGVIVSPGRLVWEKGHQDVLRAVALLRRERPELAQPRVVIVGRGPEEARLRAYAAELGIGDAVELRGFVPYEEMPSLYAGAACIVLASLSVWSWEEQFGMVLAEAMATGTPIIASSSGAIPEVAGGAATLFAPGDWISLAGHIARALDSTDSNPNTAACELAAVYSTRAAARRLSDAYDGLLNRSAWPMIST
ncbi:MAG TPA: glycosyltransferase family 4 protein [Solirubrobacteraceae bacterium]